MRRGIIASYIAGIVDRQQGERYSTILGYFIPEFITAFMIYSLPQIIDSFLVGNLASTTIYATVGTTNNLVHFLIKIAEAFQVGTVILAGQLNGMELHKRVGTTVCDTFWVTCILGFFAGSSLYVGAYWIYRWYGVSHEIIYLGTPFLQLRALGIFFTFIYFGLVGFLRGIKNTKAPMFIFTIGSIVFVICDYILIYGVYGFPQLGIMGSAVASVIQYGLMLVLIIGYIFFDKSNRKYHIQLFTGLTDMYYIKQLFALSWPVLIDKATMAWAYMWLLKMICPMGTCAVASYTFIRDIERFAFLPAIAGAQVITLLVSNDYGRGNWEGIKTNIKRVGFLASTLVGVLLLFFGVGTEFFLRFFDKNGDFTSLASGVFPIISILVFFDLIQIILSGALRGAGNVRIVMFVRLAVCLLYFVPISFMLSQLPIQNSMVKFILLYGSFYIGHGIMSVVYINHLRSEEWKLSTVKGNV